MSDNDRRSDKDGRHKHVVNADDVDAVGELIGTRFGYKYKPLADLAGGRDIGGSLYEIPPGRAAFPYHFHCVNEEALFVLEGVGTLRIGADTVAIRPGDWVSFPIGPETAHQVINSGTAPLRFLALSTKANADVVGYPDSKKIGAVGAPPGSRYGDPRWVRVMVTDGSNVDYFHGEKID